MGPQIDWIHREPLADGLRGTKRTLQLMAELVRKDVGDVWIRQKALSIVQQCGGHNFSCEIQALFHYCRDQIIYRRDPVEVEWVADARRTIEVFGSADCDDKCVCLATLLGTLGHKSRFVVVGKSVDDYSHVYLEVATKSGWLSLDPTPEQAPVGWQARGLHRATYDIWPAGGGLGGTVGMIALAAMLYYILK